MSHGELEHTPFVLSLVLTGSGYWFNFTLLIGNTAPLQPLPAVKKDVSGLEQCHTVAGGEKLSEKRPG